MKIPDSIKYRNAYIEQVKPFIGKSLIKIYDADTFNREFGNLLKIEDNYPKIVVSQEQFEGNTYEGIKHMHIRKFLTDM